MSAPFEGLEQQVLQQAKQTLGHQPEETFAAVVSGFMHAIDWKERWIQGLLAVHISTLLLVLLLRRSPSFLTAVFFGCAGIVFFAERINSLASQHWDSFAGQDYFDEHGVFFSVIVSGPLLLILFTVLVLYLLHVADLMVRTKRRELAIRARQRAQQQGQAGAGSSTGSKKEQ